MQVVQLFSYLKVVSSLVAVMKYSLSVVLQLLHLTITFFHSESYGEDAFDIDTSSIIDYVMVDSEQKNPDLAHFFNGSYSAHDVMLQLKNNKSLIQSQIDR